MTVAASVTDPGAPARSVGTGTPLLPARIPALEGLRGVAALIVVIRHTFNAVEMPPSHREAFLEGVLSPFLDAQGAVQIFYVLSGFVLTGSLQRGRRAVDSLQFVTKRIFRIHPPYVAGVLVAFAASFLYDRTPGREGVSTWLLALSREPLAAGELLRSLRFPGTAFGQLSVGWTLEIEMIYSLAMPLLVWIASRGHWSVLLIASFVPLWVGDVPLPLLYGLDFCLGIALFQERHRLARGVAQLPGAAGVAVFSVALALFCAPQLLGWHGPFAGILASGLDDARAIVLRSAGAALLIALALALPWWRALLSTGPALLLGRISYSLYLLHFPLAIVCSRLVPAGGGVAGWLLLLAVVLAISLPASLIFHRWVERPAIQAGNRVCRALASLTRSAALPGSPPG